MKIKKEKKKKEKTFMVFICVCCGFFCFFIHLNKFRIPLKNGKFSFIREKNLSVTYVMKNFGDTFIFYECCMHKIKF